jgi:Salmonella virulence plasmid 65kDa B protein
MSLPPIDPPPVDQSRAAQPPAAGACSPPASGGLTAPTLSLPKGGGAIRGIGETFQANPLTGTASMSVPIATSPGRSGFGPSLSLAYDSGSGNGPFGFGWSLSLSRIERRTDRGIPQYLDQGIEGEDSDVFVLSGAEDRRAIFALRLRCANDRGESLAERPQAGDADPFAGLATAPTAKTLGWPHLSEGALS